MSSEPPVTSDQPLGVARDRPDDDLAPARVREIDNDWICEHYSRIYRAAWLMTGRVAEAEDLAQETFVVALDRWASFEGRSSESTWLYGILIRLVQRRGRTLARMRRRWMQYAERNGLISRSCRQAEDPQVELARRHWRESVWADVARLPASQRIAVTLRFAEEMSYQQIAETVGCATGTAKSRVHHGVKRLRRLFKRNAGSIEGEWRIDQRTKDGTALEMLTEDHSETIHETVNTASDI
jgi:RNA polymerase sigma-70 factor (ECF subfamily)